jgi:FkbM family methyltransferase
MAATRRIAKPRRAWEAAAMDGIAFHRALHRPGTIVEVGAALALPLAELPGSRVLAFEPVPSAFARLKRSVQERFGLSSHIRLNNAALGATRGIVRLEVPGGDEGGGEPVVFEVAMITLDAFALPDVTAIKLEAEGAERDVLLGAAKTLRRCRPIVSVMVDARHRDGAVRDVAGLLAPLGYEGYFSAFGRWQPVATAADASALAFYFVPGERRGELAKLGALPAA